MDTKRPLENRPSAGDVASLSLADSAVAFGSEHAAQVQLFRALADHSQEFIGICDVEFKPFYVNQAGLRMVGLVSLEAACAVKVQEFFFPEDQAFITNDFFPKVLREGRAEIEIRFRHFKTGAALWMIYSVFELRDAQGRVSGYATVSRDVTERKRAEAALQETETRLRIAKTAAKLGIYDLNPLTGELTSDERARELLDLAPGEPASYELFGRRLHPADRAAVQALMEQALDPSGTGQYYAEHRLIRRGRTLWVAATGQATFVNGRAVRLVGTVQEITDRKLVEEALRASEARFDLAVRSAGVGIWDYDIDTGNVYFSPLWKSIFGYDEKEIGNTVEDWSRLLHPEEKERILQLQEDFLAGTGSMLSVEYRLRHRDGSYRWIQAQGLVVRDESGKPRRFVGSHADITDRKQAEEQVRRRAEELQGLLETVPAAVWISHDRECKTIAGNAEANRIYEAVEAENVSATTRPEPRRFFTPEGRELAASELPMQAAAAGNREVRDSELQVLLPSGKRIAIVGSAVPLRDEKGAVRGCIAAFLDITARKEAERVLARDKEELLRLVEERTAKLQELVGELEHFSYSITHDLKSPLRAMRGFAEMAAMACAEGKPCESKEFLGRIATAAERMDRLIADALNYSRAVRQELPLEDVDAGALLRGMLDSYPELQPSKARIRVEGRLPVVLANEAGLTQVFSNLLGNAVKFVKPGERPDVLVRAEREQGQEGRAQSGWVRIWVEDKGIGISKQMRPRLFDMFARGSKEYEGTGIGLALVRKVVQRMGGRVGVESEEGQGSRFWIELKYGDEAQRGEVLAGPALAGGLARQGTVLYVEDEKDDAMFMGRAFGAKGLTGKLQVVGDGRAAIEYLSGSGKYGDRQKHPVPALVLLDLNLPQVPGFEVLGWIRNNPDYARMPVVIFSSSTRADDRVKAKELGADEFVAKPSSGMKFREVVEQLQEKWLARGPLP